MSAPPIQCPADQRDVSTFDSNERYIYHGNDLGITYSKARTGFRVWAPLAEKAQLVIYKNGDIDSADPGSAYEMERGEGGTWFKSLTGDLNGIFYTYRVTNNDREVESADPYAIATGVNGDRSAVVDLASTDPSEWTTDQRPSFSGRITDAVIYELHLRDLSMGENSGIRYKGKYLQFTEEGSKGPGGVSTGIDHLTELGITHLHLLPTYDYASINEKHLERNEFNWGYDPKNYNVPEGSYATDPFDPAVRIKEYKEMVLALHKKGIRIVFDAVYNHTFHNYDSWFHRIVPGYYYRMGKDGDFADGTGCGNETASERKMMRKFMVDSVKYWVTEYHIDGFRFDLMGIHDLETMREIRAVLDRIDPGIILFGEGWDLGNLSRRKRTIQPHAPLAPGIGFFNDHVRDNLCGPWNNDREHGFIDGHSRLELEVMQAVVGSVYYNQAVKDYNAEPGQSINYLANHDNQTLWDKLASANPGLEEEEKKRRHQLGAAILLTAQGVAYLQAGVDFLRTKGGEHNSYRSPDYINALDWGRKHKYLEVVNYFKGLIALRQAHPAFRMPAAEMIRRHLSFLFSPRNTVAFLLKNGANGDTWRHILVVYNTNQTPVNLEIPDAHWYTVLNGTEINLAPVVSSRYARTSVEAFSALILYTQDQLTVKDFFEEAELIKTGVNSDCFLTETEQIRAEGCIKMEGDSFYLPFNALTQAIGAEVRNETADYLEVVNGSNRLGINKDHSLVEINGSPVDEKLRMRMDHGVLMVRDDLAEEVLGHRILPDFRRYLDDTSRGDYFQPDLYIVKQ